MDDRQAVAMAASEAAILDALGDAIHVIDTEYRVIFANSALKALCASLGLPPDPTGLHIQDICPAPAEAILAECEQVFTTQQPLVTLETTTLNGMEFTTETRKVPLIEDGVVVLLVTVIRDISDQTRQEAELRESEQRLRTLLDSSADAIVVTDLDGIITDCNKAALQVYGYASREHVLGRNCLEFVAPEGRAALVEGIARTVAEGTGRRAEHTFQRSTGTQFPAHVAANAVRGADGQPSGLIAIVRDITESKRAEAELEESEARMRAIFETSADAILVFDQDGRIVLTNPAAERMHGYEPGEMIGLAGPDFVHPISLHVFEAFVRELPVKGYVEVEAVEIRKDGSAFDIEVRGSTFQYRGKPHLLSMVRDVTERKQAEEALRESEARMRAIFETSADAMVVYSAAGAVVTANPAAERMYGYARGAMVGVHSRAIVHPDHYPVFEDFIERLRNTGEFSAESADMRTDGSVFDVEVRGSLFQYQGESHFLAIVRDVTDRKRAEEALRLQRDLAVSLSASSSLAEAAESLLQAALSLDGIDAGGLYLVDPSDGSLVLTAHSGISMDFASLISRYAPDATETAKVMAGKPLYAPYAAVSPGADSDGRSEEGVRSLGVAPILCRGRAVASLNVGSRTDRGIPEATRESLEAIAAQAGTVLARIHAEEAVREREQRLDLALHGGDLGAWDWDLRNGWVAVDARWLAGAGATAGNGPVDDRAIREFICPEDLAVTNEAVRAHLSGETPFYEAEFRVRRHPDEWTWVLSRGRITERDDDGTAVRMCGTYLDITEQKRLEEHLLQATKMEAIGRLAGGIAHDFNNILTAISGYTEFAIEQLDRGSPAVADLEQVAKAAGKATALTRQLLAFSRQQVTESRPVNLNAVVRDMEKMLRRVIGEDLELSTFPTADIGLVWADLGQIEQVIMNLCVNARDAMPGGGRLTIRTRNYMMQPDAADLPPGLQPGEYVCLDMIDTGAGMDGETLSHIYEPFFTTKQPGEGTGLGLATVYGIVQQAGGHIQCRSEPGRGTHFTVYLPRYTEAAEETDRSAGTEHTAGGMERLLLVEDDEVVRDFAAEALRRQGYQVTEAAGPTEALAIAEEIGEQLAGLVTDVIMPDMTGRELADTLTATYPHLAVLYVSGYAASAIEEENLLGPGTSFLSKPFSVRSLGEKVREVLDGRTEPDVGHRVRDT